jgi:hypothetical protein
MNTKKTTSPAIKALYKIGYVIRDGNNEYACTIKVCFDRVPSEREIVTAVYDNYAYFTSDNKRKAQRECARKEIEAYLKGGILELGGDYRLIQDIYLVDDRVKVFVYVQDGCAYAEYNSDAVDLEIMDFDSAPEDLPIQQKRLKALHKLGYPIPEHMIPFTKIYVKE